jgi:predicted acylesterase/phospholipase RssA
MNIPDKERAIVLQVGGSLGAFEAGTYRALYEKLSEDNQPRLLLVAVDVAVFFRTN